MGWMLGTLGLFASVGLWVRFRGGATADSLPDEGEEEKIPPHERLAWQTPELVAVLGTHTLRHWAPVNAAIVSPNGKWIATGCDDRVVRLWDFATGIEIAALSGHKGRIVALAFSPDGKTLASSAQEPGQQQGAWLWDLDSQKVRAKLPGHKGLILALAFASKKQILATASEDMTVKLWSPDRR